MKQFSYIDAHTHKVQKADVKSLVNISLQTKVDAIPNLFSIGIHPWDVTINESIEFIENQILDKRCYAIGETGLDRSEKYSHTIDQQKIIFKKHIQLSNESSKPLIVHCVKAFSDIIEILNQHQVTQKILFHDYNGNDQITKQLLRFDSYFGYGGKLFYKESRGFKALKGIPIERVLFETDDLLKEIQDIYLEASKILNIELEVLKRQIENNFETFLTKKELDK